MSLSMQEQRAARARQLQADVLVHEVYESENSNMTGTASDVSAETSDVLSTPSEAEIQHYTRLLNNPGQIQSHGALLLVDEKDGLKIKAASNNCGRILGRSVSRLLWGVENDSTGIVASSKNVSRSSTAVEHEGRSSPSASRVSPSGLDAPAGEDANGASDADAYVGGMSLLDLFEERGTIETAITLRNLDLANPVTVNISKSSEGALGGCVNLILSRVEGDGLLIDIEPLDPTENTFAAHQKVRAATERLHKLNKVEELCQEVCNSFKSIYNYNRVMVYRFHEDFHGEVVAENLDPDAGMEPYLNLHYPATDLPQKTRDQIKAERVRTLVDAKNTHADIVTWNRLIMPPSAINLGHSTLRRAHKCHLEYLENMGVTASIAVALVVREQLWGLVIGHHWTPKFVSYQMRMAGDFLAQAFSMRITSILDKENHEQHRATLDLHAKLVDNMAQQGLNPGLRLRGLVSSSPSLMDLVPGVCGAAVVYGGKVSTVGTVPSQEVLVRLAKAIDEHWLSCSSGREPKGWDRLSQLLRGNIGDSNQCAGVLSVPVVEDGQLLFLRPELSTTIRWAGDPNKYVVRGQTTGALHPRASFEIYSDSVRGQCAAWKKSDIDAAMGLGLLVNDTAHTAYLREADPLDDNGLGMRLVKADHERTLGEAEITQQETKRLMDSVQAPVFAVDGQLQLVQWNNMCERLTGYKKSQVLGSSVLDLTAKRHQAGLREVLLKALSSGDEARSFQVSLVKARAHELPEIARNVDLLLNAASSFDLAGNVAGVHCVCQDVTSNRITKDSQEVLSAQLQQIVKLANQLQPNFFDATESQFDFFPDKEQALLGEGAFGKTYKMRNKIDCEVYAVKMIKVKKMQKSGVAVEALKREVHMLLQLNSPYIVRYFTCFMRKEGKYFCIVMELADGGTLTNLIKSIREEKGKAEAPTVSEGKLQTYLKMMGSALDHIHSKRMLHRDLKPDNILLSSDGSEIKITDFGLACVASSELGVVTRAGTLTYASPEKAASRAYGSKDDIWALGCILSELLTGISLAHRCAGGVMAFNPELTARVVQDCTAQSQTLGSIVALLLHSNPELRPSAQEVLAMLGSGGGSKIAGAAHDLCPEYLCCLCQSLVVDATSVCSEDHVFCYMCLDEALLGAKECPRCREPVQTSKIRTQRVVNNMADKLAKRVLKPADLQARQEKIEASKNLRLTRAKEAKDALVSTASEVKTEGLWFRITGSAQLGSACSVLRHRTAGSVVEMFHVNGWFRFRSNGRAGTKWCNSCCVIGDSDFGAPSLVQQLDAAMGEAVTNEGIAELNEDEFWSSRVVCDRVVCTNVDDEALVMLPDGGIVWLSHQGMDKGLVVRPEMKVDASEVEVMRRSEALAYLGVDSSEALFDSPQSQAC